MRESSPVENNAIDIRLLKSINELSFLIALEEREGDLRELLLEIVLDVGQRRTPVDLGFALAQHVQVGAVYYEQIHRRCGIDWVGQSKIARMGTDMK